MQIFKTTVPQSIKVQEEEEEEVFSRDANQFEVRFLI